MSQITTHVLDTTVGAPASDLAIVLERSTNSGWKQIAHGETDDDGRIGNLLAKTTVLDNAVYRMIFDTAGYFDRLGIETFYPVVYIYFEITDTSHYHIPLLLSPFGYTTYRGS